MTKQVVKAFPSQSHCDACEGDLRSGSHFYDVMIPGVPFFGRWGWTCENCFNQYRATLGPGRGQEYDSETDIKTRG